MGGVTTLVTSNPSPDPPPPPPPIFFIRYIKNYIEYILWPTGAIIG